MEIGALRQKSNGANTEKDHRLTLKGAAMQQKGNGSLAIFSILARKLSSMRPLSRKTNLDSNAENPHQFSRPLLRTEG